MPEEGRVRARREKVLAQVTFNWISTDQSDSTTQIWSVITNSWGFAVNSSQKIAAFRIRFLVLLVRRAFAVCSGRDHQ